MKTLEEKRNITLLLVIGLLLNLFLTGCGNLSAAAERVTGQEMVEETVSQYPVPPKPESGEASPVISSVYTTREALALVFTGMGSEETMMALLDQLDEYQLHATFFLPGMRVAEEPDIAREILDRGHEIENFTLNGQSLTALTYEEAYREIDLAAQIIQAETGYETQYVASRYGGYPEEVLLAAAQAGQQAVSFSLKLRPRHMETVEQIEAYVRRDMNRGNLLAFSTEGDTALVAAIPRIVAAAQEVDYQLMGLKELLAFQEEKRPYQEIAGGDAAQMNPETDGVAYQVIKKGPAGKKQVALTLDDWGSDYTIMNILNTLEAYDVPATFFLRTNGVEKNPNLARAILDRGHEVANHTYSHPVITQVEKEALQEEVVRSHQILTEALQEQPAMYFRPPTGAFDDRSARIVAATGYDQLILYDVTTYDWKESQSAETIVQIILEKTTDGSIILLHLLDGIHTPEALPQIIEGLRQRGYSFVTVGDMLKGE